MKSSILPEPDNVSKEEIEWVKSKHDGINKATRRILKEALELGDWFIDAESRVGLKKSARGGQWYLWLGAHFPRISIARIGVYVRLAKNRTFLEQELSQIAQSEIEQDEPTITKAINLIKAREREAKRLQIIAYDNTGPLDRIADQDKVWKEALIELRDSLKSYVYECYRLKHLEAEISERIRLTKLTKRQARQAIEWACREHPEVLEEVIKAFLSK